LKSGIKDDKKEGFVWKKSSEAWERGTMKESPGVLGSNRGSQRKIGGHWGKELRKRNNYRRGAAG